MLLNVMAAIGATDEHGLGHDPSRLLIDHVPSPFFAHRVSERTLAPTVQEAEMTPPPQRRPPPRAGWTFAIVSVALFMVTLDNLVVSTALPTIRVDLGASLESLEWTVNAYTLAFAVLLLTGAALGDRFGRRRMFGIGIGLFTLSSAAAALAPTTDALVAARAAQGVGAAIVAAAHADAAQRGVPVEKRGLALGAWSGISGLGVALGPVVGGAVVDGISWHWIFWINVPIGLALVPALAPLPERVSRALAAARPAGHRRSPAPACWASSTGSCAGGAGLDLADDRRHDRRGPGAGGGLRRPGSAARRRRCCRCASSARAPSARPTRRRWRCSSASSARSSCCRSSSRRRRACRRCSPGCACCRGRSCRCSSRRSPACSSDRIGARPLMATGLALQAIAIGWLAAVTTPTVAYSALLVPFVLAGAGMALVFAPAANAVLASVQERRPARPRARPTRSASSAASSASRSSRRVFTANGGYESPQAYVDGMNAALPIGAAVLGAGALLALLIPGKTRSAERRSKHRHPPWPPKPPNPRPGVRPQDEFAIS